MGKGKRKPWRKHNKGKTDGNVWNQNQKGVRQNYADIIKANQDFETFYKLQKICPEEEWESFMAILKTSLPTTFRITATRSEAQGLLHILQDNLIRDAVIAGKSDTEVDIKPFALPWYPDNFGWQLNLTRKDIRRNESYFRLHNFLISETASGNISRQEAVSMIPPLALQVEPHHKVLDMCAAPGSKTAQIIEILQKDENKDTAGMLVANDMDNKRCYMLVHQAKRLQSPAFLITNHDAAEFPDLLCTAKDGSKEQLKFDRILCDVPCSGDGTIRKNIDIWKKWSTANALSLHNTQYDILKRGLELLKNDGYLVYSTCSLNPVENEAVVHRMLKDSQGSVQLVDINLPHLKHSPGLTTWTPCSRDLVPYHNKEEVLPKWKTVVTETMFPPDPNDISKYPLEKCVRVLSHQQDSGNFFIALFTKTRDLPWVKTVEKLPADKSSEEQTKLAPDSTPVVSTGVTETKEQSENGSGVGHKRKNNEETKPSQIPPSKQFKTNGKKLRGYREDPYIFLLEDDPIWKPIKDFYSLEDSLKSTNFLTRSVEGKKRNIYFVTDLVKDIVISNEHNVRIINTGVKAFARCGQNNKWTPADFRLAQEGLKPLLPYLKGRRVHIPKEDLVILFLNEDDNKPPLITTLSEATQAQLLPMERGSCVLVIDSRVDDDGPEFCLELVGWRGSASLRAYVPKVERMHYLRLCGGDVSKFETNKFQEAAAEDSLEGDGNEVAEDAGENELAEDAGDNEELEEEDANKAADAEEVSELA